MATRRPLVLNDGLVSELLDGDTVRAGTSTIEVIAGSGLTGGGSVSTNPELDLALAPNPSGIIYVGDALGIDGAAGVTADIALASGSAAVVLASDALASGNNSLVVASAALASGNAALDLVPTLGGGGGGIVVELTAASAVVSGYSVGFDDAGKVQSVRSVVTDNSNPMSFPSAAVVFESANSFYISTIYDSTNNKIVIAYLDVGNSSYGTAIVGTVSGTSISFGTAVVFESANSNYISTIYDSTNNKIVIAYRDVGNSNYGTAIVGTVSGTSISFGTAVVFESANSDYASTTYDSANNKVVIAYRDNINSSYGTAVVGTVSGTSMSFGTAVVFESATSTYISTTYDSTNNRVVIAYIDNGNSSYGTAIVGTVSGTSISFGTAVVFESAASTYTSLTYDPTNNRVVISYADIDNANYGTAIVADALDSYTYNPTVNSYPNVLGIAQSTVASGSPCLVNLPGTLYNEPAANLTTGAFYYANPTTSGITTTSTKPTSWDGQVPWNYIGRAVTSSGLMLLKSI